MRKIILLFTTLLTFVVVSVAPASAQSINNFFIDSFSADYYLTKNEKNVSQLKVVEKITATFPQSNQNHGIERVIPEKYKKNKIDLKIESVKKENGSPWNYSTKSSGGNTILRIGDADKYVHGRQTFVISYAVRDVITFATDGGAAYDHDEWYWDINGDQWQQDFGTVLARLHIPTELAGAIKLQPKCFTGKFNSSESNCSITRSQTQTEEVITISTNVTLGARENMSFVLGFNKGTFTKYKTSPTSVALLVTGAILIYLGPPLIAGLIMNRRWRRSGKDPKGRGIIVAQYSVPTELNPVLADIILNERMQTKAISATLIGLCVRGYVKLYEVEKKKLIGSSQQYEVELVKNPSDLSSEEQKVVSMIFSSSNIGAKINLSDMQNKLYKEAKVLTANASKRVAEQGYFEENPQTSRKKYTGWGIALVLIGGCWLFVFPPAVLFTAGIAVAGIVVLIFGNAMPKRTQKGVDMKEYLKGVGEYMKMAESERIKFLQAPDTAEKIDVSDNTQLIKLYEKLLPYAVLFGIEKEWAKQFANLYSEGQSPSWYNGHSAFNAVVFSNALTSFNTAAVSSFSAPSSSGSSGYSGGGGFSGGGGGGGGGGGW